MELSLNVSATIKTALQNVLHSPVAILDTRTVSGGSINKAYRLQTDKGIFFIKINDGALPLLFEAEAKGLALLRSANEFYIPKVISSGLSGKEFFLITEFIFQGARKKNFFFEFGCSLARMHRHTAQQFGSDHDNYIGSLPQSNRQHADWISFFMEERLEKQLKLAFDSHVLSSANAKAFHKLYVRLEEIFPMEKPALLHGDLWSGNFMTGPDGNACIFDPAVYYGHREMDIAMSKLFGGFDKEFYEGYTTEWVLEKKWEQRVDICNLYPLLVHVNLFGGGYASQVESIIRPFR